jgi:hypothetical protein
MAVLKFVRMVDCVFLKTACMNATVSAIIPGTLVKRQIVSLWKWVQEKVHPAPNEGMSAVKSGQKRL